MLKKIGSVLSYLLIAVEGIFIIFMLISKLTNYNPNFFGYNFYVIVSPSMSPEINVGDVILSKKVDSDTVLNEGDIISYQGLEGEFANKIITHRVYEIKEDGTILTKGDANNSIDPAIEKKQVYSVMVCKCFVIGIVYKILSTPWGFLIFLVAPLIYLIVSEIINIVKIKSEGNEDEKQKE